MPHANQSDDDQGSDPDPYCTSQHKLDTKA